jgi:hypothetical protein
MRLPSMRKFDDGVTGCNTTFVRHCVGPAAPLFRLKLSKAVGRERGRFLAEYNQRLFNGLLSLSVAGVVVARFVLRHVCTPEWPSGTPRTVRV